MDFIFGSFRASESLLYVLVDLAVGCELYFAYQLYGARHSEMELTSDTPASSFLIWSPNMAVRCVRTRVNELVRRSTVDPRTLM